MIIANLGIYICIFQNPSVAMVKNMDVNEHFVQFVRTCEDASVFHCFVFHFFFYFSLNKIANEKMTQRTGQEGRTTSR